MESLWFKWVKVIRNIDVYPEWQCLPASVEICILFILIGKPLMEMTLLQRQVYVLTTMFPGWPLHLWIQREFYTDMILFGFTHLPLMRTASPRIIPASTTALVWASSMSWFGSESSALCTMCSAFLAFHCYDFETGSVFSLLLKYLLLDDGKEETLYERWDFRLSCKALVERTT